MNAPLCIPIRGAKLCPPHLYHSSPHRLSVLPTALKSSHSSHNYTTGIPIFDVCVTLDFSVFQAAAGEEKLHVPKYTTFTIYHETEHHVKPNKIQGTTQKCAKVRLIQTISVCVINFYCQHFLITPIFRHFIFLNYAQFLLTRHYFHTQIE